MESLLQVLSWLQLGLWIVLALASARLWLRRRDATAAWLASAFSALALVVVLGDVLPDTGPVANKLLIAPIVLFPYLLYRFMTSMLERIRVVWATVHLLTGVLLVWTLLLPRVPQGDEPRPAWFAAYALAIAVQWGFLLGVVTWRLWRSGRDQAAVARRRMRLMAVGAFLLGVVLVAAAVAPTTEEAGTRQLVTSLLTIAVGPTFLLGFAPPAFLRALWRRQEEIAMREMEIELVKSMSRSTVADAVLSSVLGLLGGSAAALLDSDGEVLGSLGPLDAELPSLLDRLPLAAPAYEPVETDSAQILRMENGWLIVKSGPVTPFFGTEELKMLSASAVIADLALGRARLFELEVRSREAMRDFVAIASHELRTPTTVIQGFARLLGDNWEILPEDRKQEAIGSIGRQVEMLDHLIGDLLTVSKLDVEEIDLAPRSVDLVRVVEETIEAVAPGSGFTCSTDGRPTVVADPHHVARMVSNYIGNAHTYGEPPYSVQVVSGSDSATVYVRDEGPGVPDSFLSDLFGRFARADKKRSRAKQGTGLGLSIVRGLARANGGDAWYEHNRPRGACFAFRLPLESMEGTDDD